MVCTYPTKNLASALCLAFLCKLAELFFFLRLHVAGSVASSVPLWLNTYCWHFTDGLMSSMWVPFTQCPLVMPCRMSICNTTVNISSSSQNMCSCSFMMVRLFAAAFHEMTVFCLLKVLKTLLSSWMWPSPSHPASNHMPLSKQQRPWRQRWCQGHAANFHALNHSTIQSCMHASNQSIMHSIIRTCDFLEGEVYTCRPWISGLSQHCMQHCGTLSVQALL